MRLPKSVVFIFFISIMILSLTGCYYDKEELLYNPVGCAGVSAKFSANIHPLILSKCAIDDCHNATSAAGGTVLLTYSQISAKAPIINQRCVIEKTMPPTGPLLPAEIASLKCWIDAGAPNN